MTVRTLAFALMALGLVLLVLGWLTVSPAGFVGVTLIALGIALLWTRRTPRHGR